MSSGDLPWLVGPFGWVGVGGGVECVIMRLVSEDSQWGGQSCMTVTLSLLECRLQTNKAIYKQNYAMLDNNYVLLTRFWRQERVVMKARICCFFCIIRSAQRCEEAAK